MKLSKLAKALAGASVLAASGGAFAALTTFQSWTGNIGYSSDGWGGTSQSGVISASVPLGSEVIAAYLYSSAYSSSNFGGTLNGVNLNYTLLPVNVDSCCALQAARVDVTNIVKSVVDGGAGGVYDFNVTESYANQDGEALVVVYRNAALATASFGLLDGFSLTSGDQTAITFANALDPTQAGFKAEMVLGIGFSYNNSSPSQVSAVKVNGSELTSVAGSFDDGEGANGGLITVGGFDDPYTAIAEGDVTKDHERYDIRSFVNPGDTVISVDTFNASKDDNVFLAGFYVSGEAGFNAPPPVSAVPEPSTYALMLLGLGAVGVIGKRRRSN
jgi:hypothetical protein